MRPSPKASPSAADYRLLDDGRFVIRDYNSKRPFSDFLPGIAGLDGTPMWVFTVNRGQAVASFGTRNKDNAMLEFFPANKAYQHAGTMGFRTFIKVLEGGRRPSFYEPFREPSAASEGDDAAIREQSLEITSHELVLRETNPSLGIEFTVRYFTVPGEPIAALARELTLRNTGRRELTLEVLDGLPQVNPYGMNEFFVKHMSRTIEAWMISENVERRAPFLRLRVDATDRPEVVAIEEGNFFFGTGEGTRLLEPIVDPAVIFGSRLDFGEPNAFHSRTPWSVPSSQITANRTPCAFLFTRTRLAPGQTRRVRSYYGQAPDLDTLNRFVRRAARAPYFEAKAGENRRIIESVKGRLFTVSASRVFDLYCGQTYLDNVMRGGQPVMLGPKGAEVPFYVYSRKHGDLERDYNRFLVEPTYFSQGDGNYRDVNQNRRNDVWFEPRVKDSNVHTFLGLLQLDGFNPLVVKGSAFSFRRSAAALRLLRTELGGSRSAAECAAFLSHGPVSPGDLCRFLEARGFLPKARFGRFLDRLVGFLRREERAEHGEGFWTDHWTYNLDLIESYLAIYPEDARALCFGRRDYAFRDSDHFVRPRAEKYRLKSPGEIRQYGAVAADKEKTALIASRGTEPALVRAGGGKGKVYRTTLFVKLLALFANKLASLDPEGRGIEMEADKPSWYDALNGLPGLFGSSLCETFELKRLALFLIAAIDDEASPAEEIVLPEELHELCARLGAGLEAHFRDKTPRRNFIFWDLASSAKERYRARTRRGLSGSERRMRLAAVKAFIEHGREKIEIGIERSFDAPSGLYPTYFENRMVRYRARSSPAAKAGSSGRPQILAQEFRQSALPFFLEGPVHALKVERDPAKRKALFRAVRQSQLYDPKLRMYKVNSPLERASLEIGRARVFAPGWLENESIWLHMEYKFMLETLRAGMTDEFFEDFRNALVPFQPADRYGRSPLENSSFIVSSTFADSSLHGAGFIARLSGSTAEFLSMWLLMNAGKRPFLLGPDGKLSLRLAPTLPAWLFLKESVTRTLVDSDGLERRVTVPKDAYAFLFLGKTLVVYHNPRGLATYGRDRVDAKRVTLTFPRGAAVEFRGDTVPSPYANKVRDERVLRIDVELG